MDNIVKIAIIVGIIIIGITGVFVYIKIKQINEEEDTYDEIKIDNNDSVKLDLLDKNNGTWVKDNQIDNNEAKINNKPIDKIDVVEKGIPEVKVSDFQTSEDVKGEVVNNKINVEQKAENKLENKLKNKQISNVNTSVSNKPYANKYSSASMLISPVGYYSNELVRNDLMGKRASKVEKSIVDENIIKEEVKSVSSTTTTIEKVPEVNEEVKKESSINKISFADMKQTYVKKEDRPKNFMEEVSEKLSKEIRPQTIELTDYEQKQEDEAIISYQELLANKDKTFNISDDEEDEDFISALKSFRKSL